MIKIQGQGGLFFLIEKIDGHDFHWIVFSMDGNDGDAQPGDRILAEGDDAQLIALGRLIMFGTNPFENKLDEPVVPATLSLAARRLQTP